MEPSEARKAFLKLAYTKFKHLPLYLEWAPEDTFTTDALGPPEKIEAPESSIKVQEIPRKNEVSSTKVEENKKEEDDEEEPEPDTTLYIKNLNFSTTDDQLKKVIFQRKVMNNVLIIYNIFSIFQNAENYNTQMFL